EVEAGGRERKLLGVGLFQSDRHGALSGLAPRLGDHGRREVDAGDAMAPAGELEGEKAGAAPGVERVEPAAGRKNEIEDAIPRGALGRRADAVAEVFVESGRPPVPVRGDLLLDDVRWAGLAGGAHEFTPSRSLRSALHPAPPGSRRAGRCWSEALPGCGRPWPGTGPGYLNSRRCRPRCARGRNAARGAACR